MGALQPGSSAGTAGSYAERRSGSEVDAFVKITVTSQGLYRVSQTDLTAAGVDASCLVGGDVRMYCRTQEVGILVSSEGLWSTNDYLLFYGLGLDSYYTRSNVYWLGLTPGGERMPARDAQPLTGVSTWTTACKRVRYAPDNLYRSAYRPLEDSFDHWFAHLLVGGNWSNFPNTVSKPVVSGSATGIVRLTIHGLGESATNNPDHFTRIYVNSSPFLTNLFYDGQVTATSTVFFSTSWMTDNATTVGVEQLIMPGVSSNLASGYLDFYELHYPRWLLLVQGRLAFGGEASSNNYRLDGFASTNGAYILDVTDPFRPVRLTNMAFSATPNGFAALFGDTVSSAACYFAASTATFQNVRSVERVHFRNLADGARQADYLVVTPYAFRTNAYRLMKYREKSGLKVAVAPLADIYNEFGYGITDVEAIKHFVGYAFHHWTGPAPRYVVLLGDGTYDPKDNDQLGTPDNWVPVKLSPGAFFRAPEDNWYVTVNGSDKLVDLALGRIAVTSDIALGRVVDKIIWYEGQPTNASWRTKSTLIADKTDGSLNFKTASDLYVKKHLTNGGYTANTEAYYDGFNMAFIRPTIAAGINSTIGRAAVNYFGHGAFYQWAQDNLFNTNDIAGLTNTNYPIVSVFSCNSGAFQNSTSQTVAEAFVNTANKGAVACVAPTEVSVQAFTEKIADGYFEAFAVKKERRLGDALNLGLSNLYFNGNTSAGELLSYEVFGDPALEVHKP
jgi:hypothetical protein